MSPHSPAPDANLAHTVWTGPIGPVGLVSREGTLAAIALNVDPDRFSHHVERTYGQPGREDRAPLEATIRELEEYFAGRRLVFRLDLDLDQGTPFQRRVWRKLREIPYGETVTYKEIASAIGQPSATRAVGGAIGANPIPLVIPCHRVVAAGGRIGGFSGGLRIKTRLLDLETRTRMEASPFGILSENSRGKCRPRPWR